MNTPKTGRPTGRPTKFTPGVLRRILRSAGRGLPLTHIAGALNISTQGLINYRRANPRFEEALGRAIAKGVDTRLRMIEEASANDWRAAAWLLEHCQPQHFARNRIEVTGADGQPLTAGVTLYLPQKQTAIVEASEPVHALVITEGVPSGNGN